MRHELPAYCDQARCSLDVLLSLLHKLSQGAFPQTSSITFAVTARFRNPWLEQFHGPSNMHFPLFAISALMAMARAMAASTPGYAARYRVSYPLIDTRCRSSITSSSNVQLPPDCTFTAYTAPVIQAGPTSTYYSLTTYTSRIYDCQGCNDMVVMNLGHVFVVWKPS